MLGNEVFGEVVVVGTEGKIFLHRALGDGEKIRVHTLWSMHKITLCVKVLSGRRLVVNVHL
jgi:hypothetical protein